jgi:hypothetical protein
MILMLSLKSNIPYGRPQVDLFADGSIELICAKPHTLSMDVAILERWKAQIATYQHLSDKGIREG